MIRISHVWIFFVALLAAAQTSPSTGGSTSSKDEEAVRAAEQRFHRDFVQGDIKDLDALLTPEFVWMHGNGKVGVKEGLLDALGTGRLKYRQDEITNLRVTLYGDAAVVVGHDVRQYATGDPFQFEYTAAYVKQNGQWKVAMFHSALCPCASDPNKMPQPKP